MKRIAVAGYGMMGERHILSLKALGYEVSVLLGRDKDRTENAAKRLGIKEYCTEFDYLLDKQIDVLHVCTPPVGHYSVVKKAIDNGMHIICEKPFVLDSKEGEELALSAAEKGIINAVCFNVRYHNAIYDAKNIVLSGKIGDVLLVNGSYMQEFHSLPSFYSWRYQEESAGKFLATTEIGSHWIDLMRFLTGKEIEAVLATYGSFFPERVLADGMQWPLGSKTGEKIKVDSENVAIVQFKLAGGALASMVLSEITPGKYNFLEMTLTGSSGSLWWNSEDLNHLKMGTKGRDVSERVYAFGDGFNDSVTNMLSDIYKDIEAGAISNNHKYATFSDGAINAKICNAIYKSAKSSLQWERI